MSNLIYGEEDSNMNAHNSYGAAGTVALTQFEVMRRLHTRTLLGVLLLVLGSLLWRGLHTVGHWRSRSRQRQALRELDDRLLMDVDLTRQQQEQEARKPFWMA